MIPFVGVVRDELADGATPRALADQDHALEAGVLDGAHEALRVGVQGRRAGGASEGGDIGRGARVAHGRPEARVAVMDPAFTPCITAATLKGMPRYPGRNTPSTSGRPIPAIRLARRRWIRVTVCPGVYRIIERISAR